MPPKEAKARIKINKLLEDAGWRILDTANEPANIILENHVKITHKGMDECGENFEKTGNGFIDFLLLDEKGFPFIVLEAKSEEKNPLVGKEQARKYAKSQNCRYVLLSNGNVHFFWDLQNGNPNLITQFPSQSSLAGYKTFVPDKNRLVKEPISEDYIALTQYPAYLSDPEYYNLSTRDQFFKRTKIRMLREYQINAIKSIQDSVSKGSNRFLFEMATGTGKTMTAAALIKLFLRSGNVRRVLFLVDRLELEVQAWKAFQEYLKNDYKTVIYKENRDDWRKAEILVTTVQSLLSDNKYRRLFSPADFDLVISDEAHRSIGGNARAVFEYFIGYKLGLTATPKDYLKKFRPDANTRDPREYERRLLLDTYRTFGCDSGTPTFRYSLIDGVRDSFLINPTVVDARTDITTKLLSDKGYAVMQKNEEGKDEETAYFQSDFEKKFFSEKTNTVFCRTFLENALRDPLSGELGKTIIFAVSQNHAAKIAQMLNEMADTIWPGKYNSDFAMQVTSLIQGAQQMTINFTDKNNNLGGTGNFDTLYRTSKTRVCVTVGMMTTGYDCTDILNLCLMRPIFSPSDFIQMKGRGTRIHSFSEQFIAKDIKDRFAGVKKETYKLFDFFAVCEYFEEKFNYDQILLLPPRTTGEGKPGEPPPIPQTYETFDPDKVITLVEQSIGLEGMKIDRMFFQRFEEMIKADQVVTENLEAGNWESMLDYIKQEILNKPEDYFTLDKLRQSVRIDRRLTLREIIEKIFGIIPRFKSKDELLDEEFEKFIADYKPTTVDDIIALKYFFKAYITDDVVRSIIEKKEYTALNTNPTFNITDFKAVPREWRNKIPEYIKDYVPLNKFMN
jgi:type I restriction enzyme, R subunit